jgi:protein-tyrosine phosphatase
MVEDRRALVVSSIRGSTYRRVDVRVMSEHAVIVTYRLSGDGPGSDQERERIRQLRGRLGAAIGEAGVGKLGGDEPGDGDVVLSARGPDADALFTAMKELLREFPARPASIVLRFGAAGDRDAREVRVELDDGPATGRERTRRLAWEGLLNARDLGGFATADGRETCWGAIVRSDSLAELTPAGREALIGHGVRSIVDLRLPDEVAEQPNPFAEPSGHDITYANVSFMDPAAAPPETFTTLADDYKRMLDQFSKEVAAVITAVARAPEGGMLIHCAAGKDRTGLIVALLLGLAGVPADTIAEDYALSAEYLRERNEEWLENGPGIRAEREERLRVFAPTAKVMLAVLEHLTERYGGVEAYLLEAGVAADDLERIRARLLRPSEPVSG